MTMKGRMGVGGALGPLAILFAGVDTGAWRAAPDVGAETLRFMTL